MAGGLAAASSAGEAATWSLQTLVVRDLVVVQVLLVVGRWVVRRLAAAWESPWPW